MRSWYIAKSKPQKERWLESRLGQLGVEVYFPRVVTRRRGRRALEPLFPTYIFCHLDIEDRNWPAIRWASGLSYFLGTEGRPTAIPDRLVDHIGGRVEIWNGGEHSARNLSAGERVRIGNGPFAGLEGIFQHYVGSRERCRILLHVVNRLTSVEMPEGDLAMALPAL